MDMTVSHLPLSIKFRVQTLCTDASDSRWTRANAP
jgi:hypothetical protein